MANITQTPVEWSESTLKKIRENLGTQPTAFDRFNALFDSVESAEVEAKRIEETTGTRTAGATLPPGTVVTLEDGRVYEVDEAGRWIRKESRRA